MEGAAVAGGEGGDEGKEALLETHAGDGSTSLSGKPVERAKTGAWKAAPFVYVLIFADTVSVLGIAGNLVSYVYGTLHMSVAASANTVTNFMGIAYLLPIFWGFLADTFLGRFWIIACGSTLTLAGLVTLTLSTWIPGAPASTSGCAGAGAGCPEASGAELRWLYAALLLVAAGSAALKPCMLAMGQAQFDDTDAVERRKGASFFTGYYVLLNVASIFCVTALFYIQSSISFTWGYGTVTALYFLGVAAFFAGSPFFRHRKPAGSTLTRAAHVLVAAAKKWKEPLPADAADLFELDDRDAKRQGVRKVVHTPKLRCLDRAAIVPQGGGSGGERCGWEVCTVTEVENLKSVVQVAPIWVCLILVFTLYAQVMGVGVQQASTLDRRLGPHFTIPPGSSAVSLMLSGLLFILLYELFVVPPLRNITGHPQGLSPLRKIGVALFVAIVAMVVAALVEGRRVRILAEERPFRSLQEREVVEVPMSIWWLLPQFALLGWVEVLLGVAQLHLLSEETPPDMRSLAISFTFTTISIGYFVSSGLVNLVNRLSAGSGGWLADDFNTGGLRKYYYLLAILMSVDLLVFLALARNYTYKALQEEPAAAIARPNGDGGDGDGAPSLTPPPMHV